MLNRLNISYLIFSILLYIIILPRNSGEYITIFLLHILTVIVYFFTIQKQLSFSSAHFTNKNLLSIVFIYNLVFITIYNVVSYLYNQNFFVFSEVDSLIYHNYAIEMKGLSLKSSIDFFLDDYEFEDLGAVIVVSTLYRIIESNLIVNLFYLFLSIFTAKAIFLLSKRLMEVKYAFLAALTFSVSSFFIWFSSSSLKESVMVFLSVQSLLQFHIFIHNRSAKNFFYLILATLPMLLFRPAIFFLLSAAFLISVILTGRMNAVKVVVILLVSVAIIIGSNLITLQVDRFAYGGDRELMLEKKEETGMVKGSVAFTYSVNLMAGIIGPLPTLNADSTRMSFYGPGLLYRNFSAIFFLLGTFYIFKRKHSFYYPMAIFTLLEIASLVYILEGLELRKSLPHFPFLYIIAFGYISFLNSKNATSLAEQRFVNRIAAIYPIIISLLVLYWSGR